MSESVTLTEDEKDQLVDTLPTNAFVVRAAETHGLPGSLFAAVDRILAARDAAWAERLKIIDQANRDDRDSLIAFELQRAEADKARAVAEAKAEAWDEGVMKASPYGGGYARSLLIENPYRSGSGHEGDA